MSTENGTPVDVSSYSDWPSLATARGSQDGTRPHDGLFLRDAVPPGARAVGYG